MINTSGSNKVIVDSDALIGLIHKDDELHQRCLVISEYLSTNSFATIIPYQIVLESATTLARSKIITRPDLAAKLLQDHASIKDRVNYDQDVENLVAKLYQPKTSKKNTPFDYYILALAKKNEIRFVFSFDSFYKKNGLIMIEEVVRKK